MKRLSLPPMFCCIVVLACANPPQGQAAAYVWSGGEPGGGTGWYDDWVISTSQSGGVTYNTYANNWGQVAVNETPATPGASDAVTILAPYSATLINSSDSIASLNVGGYLYVAGSSPASVSYIYLGGSTFVNNGLLTLSGYYSDLRLTGDVAMSGAGSVVLNGGAVDTSNSASLSQGAGNTISGYGTISVPFINRGLVNANLNGETLTLFVPNWPLTNLGTMEASNGGTLSIVSTTVSGGTLTSTGASNIVFSYGDTLSGVTVSNDSQLSIPDNTTVTVTNGITNNGTITIGPSQYNLPAILTFSGSQTLSGTGSVVLNSGQLNTSNSGTLTQAAGHTISGYGTITATLVNQGLVNANLNGETLTLFVPNWPVTNLGTMEATNGGTLYIASTTVSGGTLTSTGTSSIATNGATLSGVTFSNGSQFIIGTGTTVTVTDGLTNNGTITVGPSRYNLPAILTFSGSQTLSGTGNVVLNDGNLETSNSGTLTQSAGHTISGYGTINAAIDNLGTIEAQNGTLTVDGPATNFSGGTLTGGTWIAENNSTLSISSFGNIATNQATIVLDGATASFPNANALAANLGTFDLLDGRSFSSTGSLANAGSIDIAGSSSLLVNGAGILVQTAGNLELGTSGALSAGTVQINGGTIIADGPGATITANLIYDSSSASTYQGILAGSANSLTLNNPAALLILSGTNNSYMGGTYVEAGTLEIASAGSFARRLGVKCRCRCVAAIWGAASLFHRGPGASGAGTGHDGTLARWSGAVSLGSQAALTFASR